MSDTYVRSIVGHKVGKRYAEIRLEAFDAFAGYAGGGLFGLYANTEAGQYWIGVSGYGRGVVNFADYWFPEFPPGKEALEAGDVCRLWADFDTGHVWVGVGALVLGDPVAGTGWLNQLEGVDEPLPAVPEGSWRVHAQTQFFPSADPQASRTAARLLAKTGQFQYGPGAGWLAWED